MGLAESISTEIEPILVEFAARRHALQRLAQGFTLDRMVSEYRSLRECVTRLWAPRLSAASPQSSVDELIRFGEAVDQALAESISSCSARVEESRSLLLGVLGHDLRNPLGAARTSAIYLLRKEGLDAAQTQAATSILNSTTRMRQMVNDLLDFSATRAGTKLPITPLHTNMAMVCRQVVEETSARYPDRILTLEVGGGDLVGHWATERVSQMLTNLVVNAFQHGLPDSPVTVTIRSTQDSVEVDVHNIGAPIAADERRTLFEPLSGLAGQAAERREGSSGLGLGLYIAQQVAVAHGGRVELSCSDVSGTTFTVLLPRNAP